MNEKNKTNCSHEILFILFLMSACFISKATFASGKSWLSIPESVVYEVGERASYEIDIRSVVSSPSDATTYDIIDGSFDWFPVLDEDYVMVTVGEASENDNHITEVKLKLLSPKTKGHIEQTVNTTAVSGTNRKKMITKLEAKHFPVSAEVIMEVNVKDKYDEIWTRRYKVKTHVPLSKILSWWPVWFHTQQWGQPKWLPGQGDRVCGLRLYNHGTLFPHDLHAREEIDVWLAKKKYEGYLDEPNQGNKVPAEDWGETINLRDKWDQSSTIAGFSICWDDHWQWMYFSSHAKVFRRDLSFKSESFINNEISMAEIVIKFEKDSKNLRLRMNTRDGEVYRNTVADKGYDH